jgi:hypothetical protein
MLKHSMTCWISAFHAQGSRGITVQVRAVKIYVQAAVEASSGKKKDRVRYFMWTICTLTKLGTIKVRIYTLSTKNDDVFILVHAKRILVLASIWSMIMGFLSWSSPNSIHNPHSFCAFCISIYLHKDWNVGASLLLIATWSQHAMITWSMLFLLKPHIYPFHPIDEFPLRWRRVPLQTSTKRLAKGRTWIPPLLVVVDQ